MEARSYTDAMGKLCHPPPSNSPCPANKQPNHHSCVLADTHNLLSSFRFSTSSLSWIAPISGTPRLPISKRTLASTPRKSSTLPSPSSLSPTPCLRPSATFFSSVSGPPYSSRQLCEYNIRAFALHQLSPALLPVPNKTTEESFPLPPPRFPIICLPAFVLPSVLQ